MLAVLTFWLFLTIISIFDLTDSSRSGIYIDNGLDETIMEGIVSNDEKREMELQILSLLGLPKRPSKFMESTWKKSAPRFLLDVYQTLMNEENNRARRNSDDFYISNIEKQQIDESDIIMTFESISTLVPNVRHDRGKRLWFNVNDVPIPEDVVGAELRIYKNKARGNKNHYALYTVTAYQLVKTDKGEKDLEYVFAVNTTSASTGWMSLNVTQCLASWVTFPNSNNGLYLSVHPVNRQGFEVRPEDIGLVTATGNNEIQPFMVAFLKAANNVKPRVTRAAASTKKHTFTKMMSGMQKNGKVDSKTRSDLGRSCRIQTLYISFKDLNWQDWIIAPNGYAAYYCTGECNFPLNAQMNATNHAIIQTLVHLKNPLRYPKPCCAPTKLSAISVLYYLDDQNVILKKYKNMAVKSCGCH